MQSAPRFTLLRAALVSGLLMAGATVTQAATLNLIPPNNGIYPDLQSFNGALNYSYVAVCGKTSGTQTGVCNGTYTVPRWDLSYGKLTYTSTTLLLKAPSNASPVNVTSDNYSLTAILGFNGTGTAISGILASDPWTGDALYTSALAALGNTATPGYLGLNLVSGTPTNATAAPFNMAFNFGYGGTEAAGIFEFVFNNVTGNFASVGQVGGVILSTTALVHALLPAGGAIETWDSKGINFWKTNFSASNALSDTFVPVPAAAWMFGSAMAVMGLVRRRRAAPRGQTLA